MAQVVRNHGDPIQRPPRPDGGAYKWALAINSGRDVVFGDDFDDLASGFLPGYADATLDERADAVADYAAAQAAALHGTITATAQADLLATLDDDERDAFATPPTQPSPTRRWSSPLPLVTLDVHYQPYTSTPPPQPDDEGAVLILETVSAEALIRSLHHAGIVTLLHAT